MFHSRSLKTIGQALELARIGAFKINKKIDVYHLTVGHLEFHLDSAGISRLSALVQKGKDNRLLEAGRSRSSLSAQMRSVGDYIDRMEIGDFRLVWTRNFAILDYEHADSEPKHRVFTAEELQELALYPPAPRSVSYLPPHIGYWV